MDAPEGRLIPVRCRRARGPAGETKRSHCPLVARARTRLRVERWRSLTIPARAPRHGTRRARCATVHFVSMRYRNRDDIYIPQYRCASAAHQQLAQHASNNQRLLTTCTRTMAGRPGRTDIADDQQDINYYYIITHQYTTCIIEQQAQTDIRKPQWSAAERIPGGAIPRAAAASQQSIGEHLLA